MPEKKKARFITKKDKTSMLADNDVRLLVDTETGVNYLVVSSGLGIDVTPLLDKNGKILIDK